MRLTLHTDLALRLLMLLALEPNDLHTIEEVAHRYAISRNHLMKVAQTLAQAGFIESLRGRGGGLRLAKTANKIKLGDIIRASEDNLDLVDGFADDDKTAAKRGVQGPLQEALAAFMRVLDGYSLADMVANPIAYKRMQRLLAQGALATSKRS